MTQQLSDTFIRSISAELNPEQVEAVRTGLGPLLILAGAGSGKTRVLTYRMVYLVATGEATPDQILAVTFTNKAAREMLERTEKLLHRLGSQGVHSREPLWISTFHSSCARILRRHCEMLGYQTGFTIYDDGEQLSLLKRICDSLDLNDKMYPAKSFQYQINEAKNQFHGPLHFKSRRGHFLDEKTAAVYERYTIEMKRNNAMDFGDLIYNTVLLFQENPKLLDQYQERFKFILIDEYQDTNHVQYLLVKLIAQKYQNICVVGDEDQSIYSWRGADITNILNFEQDFINAKVIKLEQNYRSTKNIVEAASHVIRKNQERKDKTLWTENETGDLIKVREEMTEFDEARAVVRELIAIQQDDHRSLNEFAVFYRTNAQSRVLEDQLRSNQIAYRIVGGMRFYDRAEIKDVVSYLKVLVNPRDSIALKRIINVPARAIGKTTVEKLETYADSKGLSLFDALLPALQDKVLDRGATQKVLNFYELLQNLITQNQKASPSEAYHAVLDATQYINKLRLEDTVESDSRVENLEEFDTAIGEFERERGEEGTLLTFLEELALLTDADRENDINAETVTLMTLHLSKGLEFPVVFVVGLEEGLFPSGRSIEDDNEGKIEEERRLFYVGMTRARQKLFLSYARSRKVWGQDQMYPPSRFLSEIPDNYMQRALRVRTAAAQNAWRQRAQIGDDSIGDSEYGSIGSGSAGSVSKNSFDEYSQVSPDHGDDFGDDQDGFRKGMRVRHPSYGVGTIHQLEGVGADQKVTILFPNHSLKKFVVKYARLEKA